MGETKNNQRGIEEKEDGLNPAATGCSGAKPGHGQRSE